MGDLVHHQSDTGVFGMCLLLEFVTLKDVQIAEYDPHWDHICRERQYSRKNFGVIMLPKIAIMA